MDEFDARLIPGTEVALSNPFFSPDGQTLGFYDFSTGELKRIAIQGGTAVRITTAENPFGVSWEEDGTILYGQSDGIWRVPETGGEPTRVIESMPGEAVDGPQLLPGGDWVLFTVTDAGGGQERWNQGRIVAQSLSTGDQVVIWEGGSDARYLPTGHIVYALDDDLYGLAFDLDRMEASGGSVPLVEGVQRAGNPDALTGSAHYGVSDRGNLVYLEGLLDMSQQRTLLWVDRQGREEPISAEPRAYVYAYLSPDGTRVALDIANEQGIRDIWMIGDLARPTLQRLTFESGSTYRLPVWTPDGARLAFHAGGAEIYWQRADSAGTPELLLDEAPEGFQGALPISFSPDGTQLLLIEGVGGVRRVGILDLDSGDARTLLQGEFDQNNPVISPHGQWLAYDSDESGRREIYVRPFPDVDSGQFGPISTDGGTRPLWSPDGTELLYYVEPGTLMGVSVQAGPDFAVGDREVVIDGPYLAPNLGRNYSITPDGERFLMIRNAPAATNGDGAGRPRINVVLNWTGELQERVPVP